MLTINITKISEFFQSTRAFYQDGFLKCWKTRRLFISTLLFSVLLAISSLFFIYTTTDSAVSKSFAWYSVIVWTILLLVLVVLRDTLHDLAVGDAWTWPRWISWGVIFNLIIVVTATLLSAFVKADLEIKTVIFSVASFGLLLALIILLVRIVPGVLVAISSALIRIPFVSVLFRKWLSARALYSLFCASVIIAAVFIVIINDFNGDMKFLLGIGVVTIGSACALIFSKSLFSDTGHPLIIRVMPHILLFYIIAATPWEFLLTYTPDFKKEGGGYSLIVSFSLSLIITLGSVLYLASLKLRKMPVKALEKKTEQRAESIQSRVELYVDVHKLSDRFCNTIKRADGGVFGITGVRGAGKSALTRSVLHEMKDDFFTYEMTAPVRNDSDMGFFIVICRNVCLRVLNDLTPMLFGKNYMTMSDLWLQAGKLLFGVVVVAICIIGFTSYTKQYVPGWFVEAESIERFVRDANNRIILNKSDPLLGKYNNINHSMVFPLLAERWVIDDLMKQIEYVQSLHVRENPSSEKRFLLVPKPSRHSFHFVPGPTSDRGINSFLENHKKTLESEGASSDPYNYFKNMFAGKKVGKIQVNDSKESWMQGSSDIANISAIKETFRLSSNDIYRLFAMGSQDKSLLKNSALLSHLLLNMFEQADSRLSFDEVKLKKLASELRVYRNLLEGEIGVVTNNDIAKNSEYDTIFENLRPYTKWLGKYAVWFEFLLMSAVIVVLILMVQYIWRVASSTFYTILNRKYLDIYTDAKNFMEQLSYQSRKEASTGFSWRGFQIGQKQTLAMRDLTLPGLTARYTQFLEKVRPLYNDKLVIAIDELDKIHEPEQVKSLLTEIKGALFQPGVFYLLSISEDAARAFRLRLASGRDIFESTFDYVVDIRQMEVSSAVQMLEKRQDTVSADDQFNLSCLEVAALFGGGIPREIIRAHRKLGDAKEDKHSPTTEWATWVLMKNELDQWAANLGESNLTGATTIKIREQASKALNAIGDSPPVSSVYYEIWHDLVDCIEIIDPDGLRHSVGYLAEDNGKEKDEDVLKYKEIVGDLQIVMRLLILSHLSYRLLQPNLKLDDYAPRILECHRALADKPALAEYLLHDLYCEIHKESGEKEAGKDD